MTRKAVITADAPAPIGPYSQAVLVDDVLYLSGQIPLDPRTGEMVEGGVEAQARRVMENITAVLGAAGMASTDLVKVTIYLTDLAHFPAVNEIYGRYVREPYPARATVQVSGLPKGAQLEIEAVARKR